VKESNQHPSDVPVPVASTSGAHASAQRRLISFLPHPPDSWSRCLFRMALWVDLGCLFFFIILSVLGPSFYQLMDEINWVGWCKGLNLGMGIVIVVASRFLWKQEPEYTDAGLLFGAVSIFISTVPFASLK